MRLLLPVSAVPKTALHQHYITGLTRQTVAFEPACDQQIKLLGQQDPLGISRFFRPIAIRCFRSAYCYTSARLSVTWVDCAETKQHTKIMIVSLERLFLQLKSGISLTLSDAVLDAKFQRKDTHLSEKRASPSTYLTAARKRLQHYWCQVRPLAFQ